MAKMPQYLRAMNLYVDGYGYAGQVEEITLPKLTIKTEEYRGGGADAPIEIDVGMEKLECEFTVNAYAPSLLQLWGVMPGRHVNITLRGAMDEAGTVTAVVVNLTGSWKEIDMGTWKAGEKSAMKIQVAASYYQLSIGGMSVIQIDIPNMTRMIGGQDVLREIRAAIGL